MTYLRFSFLAFVLVSEGSFLAFSQSTPARSPNTAKSAAAPAASTSSALPQLCTLLTAKDFEEAFGPGAQMGPNKDNSCAIEGPKGALEGVIGVKIAPLDAALWERNKQAVLASFPKEPSVSGIGEDAFTFMNNIVFRKGKVRVTVTAGAYTGRKPKFEAAKHIAELVATRL